MRKILLDDVQVGDVLAVDVQLKSNGDLSGMDRWKSWLESGSFEATEIDAGTSLEDRHLKALEKQNVSYVFIEDPLTDDLDEFLKDDELNHVESDILEAFDNIQGDLVEGKPSKKNVESLYEVTSELIEVLKKTKVQMAFTSLKSHDNYTAQHSLDVAKLALNMTLPNKEQVHNQLKSETAASTDYTTRYMLEDLCLGTLLHDLGKNSIPHELLTKSGELDDQEWAVVKKHPNKGVELIEQLGQDIRAPVKQPALSHHEKFGGGGYPREIEGKNIHLYGRIAGCCDVYSALTSNRSFRDERSPAEARKIMRRMQDQSEHFDPDILSLFLNTIPPHPIGEEVNLSNGTKGVVSGFSNGNIKEPIVRVLYHGDERVSDPEEVVANTDNGPQILS